MKSKVISLMMIASLATGSMLISGCTDAELGFGAGLIVGHLIGEDDHDYDHHHHERPPRYEVPGHDYQPGPGYHRIQEAVADDLSQPEQSNSTADQLAVQFSISQDSAQLLSEKFSRIIDGDITAAYEVGLDKEDMIEISYGRTPKYESVKKMADSLNISNGAAVDIVSALINSAVELDLYKRKNAQ